MRTLFAFVALSCAVFAQRHKIEEVDTEKPEGKLLQQIMQEADAAKKKPLLEQMVTEFPKHEGAAWALEQLQQMAVKAGDTAQILALGDKLLALDPDDPEAALQNLKAAKTKGDMALVKKYAGMTAAGAHKMPSAEAERAKYYAGNADYELFLAAAQSRDPKLTIDLAEALRAQSPKGEYFHTVAGPLFVAYQQSGDKAKALALAEQTVAVDQSSEDILLFVADAWSQQKKEPQKVHLYSAKAAEVMAAKPKPEGVADEAWNARKNGVIGVARYLNGKLYYAETNYAKADGELRTALPLVDPRLKAEVLFMLAFANYKLEKPQDAANYYKACAAIPGPMQVQANKDLTGLRAQYKGIK